MPCLVKEIKEREREKEKAGSKRTWGYEELPNFSREYI